MASVVFNAKDYDAAEALAALREIVSISKKRAPL